MPDSLLAIITVRDGDAVRRIVVPAGEADQGDGATRRGTADVPLDTSMRLPSESVDRLGPVLEALRRVEAAL